jgi:signal transduction histidine kinase
MHTTTMSAHPISVLYLDDEEQNLTSFRALLRRDFNVYTAQTPAEAVNVLNQEKVHVIFSDQKMPELSGVEFFELIQPDFPDAIRILLTGYADIDAVIDAINNGQVYRYLTKPWDEKELKISIENSYDLYSSREQVKNKQVELEKACDELEKFVYSASHDLRAPLLSIKGIIKLAHQENDAKKYPEYLDMINTSVNRLDTFVQGVIKYYQNGINASQSAEVCFKTLLDELIGSLRFVPGGERLKFTTEVYQNRPFMVDELRLRIILSNLLSNAIKFSDPAKPDAAVSVSVWVKEKSCVIHVADNGIGIAEEDQQRVFGMFFKSASSNRGTGIGLYIAREAVKKLNGSIALHSTPGIGTTFSIEIPEGK